MSLVARLKLAACAAAFWPGLAPTRRPRQRQALAGNLWRGFAAICGNPAALAGLLIV